MVTIVENKMAADAFANLKQRVIQMSTGIDDFIYTEMLHHKDSYDTETGMRKTAFESANQNHYSVIPVVAADQSIVNCEMISPNGSLGESVIIYVHGAAFQRRLNDINLKTADRLCTMTGLPVCLPDYRVGIDYTYDQMISDVAACYRYILEQCGIAPERVTFLADSSGCITTLQMIREVCSVEVPAPGTIILWSPQADELFDDERVAQGKRRDITLQTNDLFSKGFGVYTKMCTGKNVQEVYPAYGDYKMLKNTRILIQSGVEEIFEEDAGKLCDVFADACNCTLELYEGMFHNFQTYFSVCEMAPVCWKHMIDFIQMDRPVEMAS